jgi:exodeoxyribonuclease VII small subunit
MAGTVDFEKTLTELETIVSELDGDIKLERALELFDRGMNLSSECEKYLKSAEQKIEVLKKTIDGKLSTEPLDEDCIN